MWRGRLTDYDLLGEVDSQGGVWFGRASDCQLAGEVDADGRVWVGRASERRLAGEVDAEGQVWVGEKQKSELAGEVEPPSRVAGAALLLLVESKGRSGGLLRGITKVAAGIVVEEGMRRLSESSRTQPQPTPQQANEPASFDPSASPRRRVVGVSSSSASDVLWLNDRERSTAVFLQQGGGETALEKNKRLNEQRHILNDKRPFLVAVGGGDAFLLRALQDLDMADLFVACSDGSVLDALEIPVIDKDRPVTYERLESLLMSESFDGPVAEDIIGSHGSATASDYILELGKEPLRVTYEDAQAVIAGYCFGEHREQWPVPNDLQGLAYAPEQSEVELRGWAYRVYDCVPPSIGNELTQLDLLMPVALNAAKKYGAGLLERLRAASPRVLEAMRRVPRDAKFWDIPLDEIEPVGTPPERSISWAVHESWAILKSAPDCGMTTTHKILHHKWPNLFPLIDSRTVKKLADGASWANVHRNLTAHADAYADLEQWFNGFCSSWPEARPIGRLRMHDILLWCYASGSDFQQARDAGRQILGLPNSIG